MNDSIDIAITANDFLSVIEKKYGSVDKLKWFRDYVHFENKYDNLLCNILKVGESDTGVSYTIDLWDFYEDEIRRAEFDKLESYFGIAKEIPTDKTTEYQLQDICISASILDDNNLPVLDSTVFLIYEVKTEVKE